MNKRKNLLKFALPCCFMVSCSGEALDSGSEPVTTPDEYFISQDDEIIVNEPDQTPQLSVKTEEQTRGD